MAPSNEVIARTIEHVLEREGGFVDDPSDRGGATNFGITAATLGEWRHLGRKATSAEVHDMTVDEARSIYRANYAEPFLFIDDPKLFGLVVDSAVNHGVLRAIKLLQDALDLKPDGVVGPKTLAAVAAAPPGWLYRMMGAERLRFYGRIISGDRKDSDKDGIPDASEFAAGWLARLAKFWEESVPT